MSTVTNGIKVQDLTDTSSITVDNEIMVLTDDTNNVVKNITVENLLTNIISSDSDNGITTGTDNKLYVNDADSGVTAGTYQYPQNLVVDSKGKITSVTAGSAANIEPATTSTLGGVIVGDGLSVENDGTLSTSISVRNIGEIVTSTIPLTDAGLHLLDGTLLPGSGSYADFVDYIADLYNSDTYTIYAYVYNDGTDDYTIYADSDTTPTELYNYDGSSYTGSDFTVSGSVVYYNSNACTYTSADNVEVTNLAYFTDETTWQTSVTSYGVCGKFVYDSTNNTVRLPKITGILEGTTDLTALGDLVEAGLPNITGTIAFAAENAGNSGAFYSSAISTSAGANVSVSAGYGFNASRSSSIYGNSSTVQPQSIKVLYYIVIATSTKTDIQVDIDEIATDLNGKADIDLTNVTSVGQETSVSWGRNFVPVQTVVENNLTGTTSATYDLGFTDNKVKMGYFVVYVGAISSGGSGVCLTSDCFSNFTYSSHVTGCVLTNNNFGDASYVCIPFITEVTVATRTVSASGVRFIGYM